MKKRSVLFVAAMLIAAGASAQQYKWVDKDGKVRYGDVPPPGVKATPMKPPASGPSPAAPAPSAGAQPDAEKRKRQADAAKEKEKAEKAEQEAQVRKENCELARDALRTLESGQRISRTDAKGERYFLDDDQRAAETTKARQRVGQWCG